jgi:ATP-dependent phosphoenolpyruvate carboxykinase
VGGHPANIVFLCCDTFGLLPPVSRLSSVAQALYFFISGFTAKVAGTEQGVGQPQPTFSACYVATSLVWHPVRNSKQWGDARSGCRHDSACSGADFVLDPLPACTACAACR